MGAYQIREGKPQTGYYTDEVITKEEYQTIEEREMAKQDTQNIYCITLLFTDEEADTVRAVLQDTPADKILELCTKELNHQ